MHCFNCKINKTISIGFKVCESCAWKYPGCAIVNCNYARRGVGPSQNSCLCHIHYYKANGKFQGKDFRQWIKEAAE